MSLRDLAWPATELHRALDGAARAHRYASTSRELAPPPPGLEIGEDGDAFRMKLRGFRDEARRDSARAELESLKEELLTPSIPASVVRSGAEPMPLYR